MHEDKCIPAKTLDQNSSPLTHIHTSLSMANNQIQTDVCSLFTRQTDNCPVLIQPFESRTECTLLKSVTFATSSIEFNILLYSVFSPAIL